MTTPVTDASDAAGEDFPAFEILVVCTANICRSPTAEFLLRGLLAPDGAVPGRRRFAVSSAGVRGWDGAEMDPSAAGELRRLGGDPAGFRARSFTAALGTRADLILTATIDHRRIVLEEVPQALHRTFTLLELAHLITSIASVRASAGDPALAVSLAATHRGAARLEGYDLADPYGQSEDVHRQTAEVVLAASQQLALGLLG